MPAARWSLLSKTALRARSSHSLGITHDGLLLLHGGELRPCQPVDTGTNNIPPGSIHSFNLRNELQKVTASPGNWDFLLPITRGSAALSVPEPRVGTSAIWDKHTDSLYVWGGRGGVDMTPLDRESAGPWKAHLCSNSILWERLITTNEGEGPEPCSYHAAVFFAGKLYIHAGCSASGQLNTLHALEISSNTWTTLASAPDPGRGGTGLAVATLPDQGAVILRFGGFSGYELGDDHTLDIYDISSDAWCTVIPAPDTTHGYPGPRSVHGFIPFHLTSGSSAITVLYHGEREASKLGHAGAGAFWDDVWLLDYFGSGGDGEFRWRKVHVLMDGEVPEGRGWFPGASYIDEQGGSKAVMFGGLLSSNERSDKLWVLEIE